MANYYALLELDEHATMDDIRRNYHKLALRYHPDKAGPDGAAHFKELATAYAVLSDPARRRVYDSCGPESAAAMESTTAAAEAMFGARVVMLLLLLLLFLLSTMLLLFAFFLGAFVDGRLSRRTWTYVRVFAPVFVVCGVLLLAAALSVVTATVVLHQRHLLSPARVLKLVLSAVCVLGVVVLLVLVPIAKDRNEARTAAGQDNWVSWRVWLMPTGYAVLLSVVAQQVMGLRSVRGKATRMRLSNMRYAAVFVYVAVCLRFLMTVCGVVLLTLVACRADDVLTVSYFVVLGLPVYVGVVAWAVELVGKTLCVALVHQTSTDDSDNNNNNHANGDSVGCAVRADDVDDDDAATATAATATAATAAATTSTSRSREEAAAAQAHTTTATQGTRSGSVGRAPDNSGARNEQRTSCTDAYSAEDRHHDSDTGGGGGNGASTRPRAHVRYLHVYTDRVVTSSVVSVIAVGLVCASVSMLCVRLDYYAHHGTYAGTLSLMRALVPVYLILCAAEAALLLTTLCTCCCTTAMEQAAATASASERQEQQPQPPPQPAPTPAQAPAPQVALQQTGGHDNDDNRTVEQLRDDAPPRRSLSNID